MTKTKTEGRVVERVADFTLLESRDTGDGLTMEGYAAVFNSPTEIDSWEGKFIESIAPGAFKRSISGQLEGARAPVLQFDHGQHPMIGGLPIGVIRSLKEDAHGLFVRARLSDNWLIEPVRDAIRDGAVNGMSFRFVVRDDEWNDEQTRRVIHEVELRELGPVVFPAYADTTVGVRSRNPALAELVEIIRRNPETRDDLAALLYADGDDTSNDTPTEISEEVGTSEGHAPEEGSPEDRAEEQPVAEVGADDGDAELKDWALDMSDDIERRLAQMIRSKDEYVR